MPSFLATVVFDQDCLIAHYGCDTSQKQPEQNQERSCRRERAGEQLGG